MVSVWKNVSEWQFKSICQFRIIIKIKLPMFWPKILINVVINWPFCRTIILVQKIEHVGPVYHCRFWGWKSGSVNWPFVLTLLLYLTTDYHAEDQKCKMLQRQWNFIFMIPWCFCRYFSGNNWLQWYIIDLHFSSAVLSGWETTNKKIQTNKQTNKQQTNKQTNKQTTNKQRIKQSNKHTFNQAGIEPKINQGPYLFYWLTKHNLLTDLSILLTM